MDAKDEAILALLIQDAKLTTGEISRRTQIPTTTVHNRIRKLEQSGVIERYTVDVNYAALGYEISAIVLLTVSYEHSDGTRTRQEDIAREIAALDGIENVEIVTGEADIVLRVRARTVKELDRFIVNKLRDVRGVDKTKTMIILDRYYPKNAEDS